MDNKKHIVKKGDTLWDLSRKYYGVPTRYLEIIQRNHFLQERKESGNNDSTGVPFLFVDDVLIIAFESILDHAEKTDTSKNPLKIKGKKKGDVTLFIDGEEKPVPSGTEIITNFDTCCDTLTTRFAWDSNDKKQRKLWQPTKLKDYEIYISGEQITGGKLESVYPNVTASTSYIDVSGRSHTLKLEKSVFPVSSYPLEREGENLIQILEWATGLFGLKSENRSKIDSELKTKFDKTSADNSTKIWEYLARLATIKSRVLHSSTDGRSLVIDSPENKKPVQHFEEGKDGFSLPNFGYNTATLFGNFIGSSESADTPAKMETYKDLNFDEDSYSYIQLDDSADGETAKSLQYQAVKSYRDFFTAQFTPAGGMLNQSGKIWRAGQLITIKAPSVMIYNDFEFMIRSVKMTVGAEKTNVILSIIPPDVYSGKPLKKMPWDV